MAKVVIVPPPAQPPPTVEVNLSLEEAGIIKALLAQTNSIQVDCRSLWKAFAIPGLPAYSASVDDNYGTFTVEKV